MGPLKEAENVRKESAKYCTLRHSEEPFLRLIQLFATGHDHISFQPLILLVETGVVKKANPNHGCTTFCIQNESKSRCETRCHSGAAL